MVKEPKYGYVTVKYGLHVLNIFLISHLHGDHFFGLPGLIATFQLLGRQAELHIYGPKGIKEAITLLLKLGSSWTSFPLYFHELTTTCSEVIFEDEKVVVKTIPLKHRVYANGFLFAEQPGERKLNRVAAEEYNIDICYYQNIKNGRDVVLDDGTVLANSLLTYDPSPAKSYAFCSDTKYVPENVSLLRGVTALYHESTFLHQHADLAEKTGHSTARQAAEIAKASEVGMLILGHYSTRYSSLGVFKDEAETVFEPVFLAEDGKEFVI